MSIIQGPTLWVDAAVAADVGSQRWLVQIHPLDLDRGPIEISETILIGRDANCCLHLPDNSVSRRHAEIEKQDDVYTIRDLESTNGVVINGMPITEHVLQTGDRIQLGSRIFRFLADHDLEAQYHETVYAMMTRDGLTGVFNKRYLLESLDREVARCRRYQRPIAVILLDVDHFKLINDTYGHLAGDEVLQQLSMRLEHVLRSDEILARFGGEEFAIVIVESDRAKALDVAERCRKACAEAAFETSAGLLEVTISLGVSAPAVDEIETQSALLDAADKFLYQAKENGRNQVAG
ncbi:Response regulator PleD [Rosistilla carotiformis]|uniref:diguanylate cyclase n=1 Tax=Rosistilla carotiformis TaxID=2528017 RepID=A0A518JWD4_9BACT|nr:diguanylate cyclase [Rosistilla carotiformis]QDV69850.1 Response regulator PleD [Rosistilla carotiformis]